MADIAYTGREQTLVKHFILRKYLERFAHIIGSYWDAITYVDCFAGPWNVRSEKLEDSSFHIALEQLRKARDKYRQQGREVRMRCFFIERDPKAFPLLKDFADRIEDVEIETKNSEFEDAIGAIVRFVRAGGTKSFPFIFIDPTGWTGFGMKVIAPLLRLDPGEVLINLMTGHISRFVESPQEQAQHSFEDLFGSSAFKTKIEGLARTERLDALVEGYTDTVRHTGNFRYVCSAPVLRERWKCSGRVKACCMTNSGRQP